MHELNPDIIWREEVGEGPLVAVAIHDGHAVRDEVAEWLAIDERERLYEEDPYTGQWAERVSTRIVGTRSRFEVDLNRSRDKAVYRTPEDAWGLTVYKPGLPDDIVDRSLAEYDAFYEAMYDILSDLERKYGRFVVFDLHNYNHRRAGPDEPPVSPDDNPQVNIGTGWMDRSKWAPIVDRFMADLAAHDFAGGKLDVRENVKFRGGHFVRWVHESFPESGCGIAIEFKKFFMDEWTGKGDPTLVEAIGEALRSTVPGILEELGGISSAG